MKSVGNNQEQSGNLPTLKSEKDALMIRLRIEGRSYQEISEASGVPIKTIQNTLCRGGRLEPLYRQILQKAQKSVSESVNEAVMLAKQEAKPAMERQIELSKTAENEAALFKANEFILNLAGVSSESTLRSILKSLSYERALEKVDEAFLDIYGKPCTSGASSAGIQLSPEDVDRLNTTLQEFKALNKRGTQ